MGVPAFYRWLSEKYPKIVVDMLEERALRVEGVRVPPDLTRPNPNGIEFDNLYVDMNGIIHPCSHPEGGPQPQTEEEMYVNVFNYVDRLMNAVRPRKLLYLAIDGVAPRAKMNQQRSRRFRSAQEAEELKDIQQAVRVEMADSGHKIPPKAREPWDSNVITPGTRFMHRLSHYLHYYVQHRINTDKAWRSIKVILSDASQPGEGEHKIMEYVRQQRSQPGYDPNQHHILHGLDADLIMLGLATHEPKFTILRELVTFGRKDKEAREAKIKAQQAAFEATSGVIPDETFNAIDGEELGYKPLQMLRVWVLREYLQAEFACLEQTLPFPYDFERVVDDFVFLCFFVGNDFLPHLPSLDIRDGALDFLQNVYKRCLPAIGDYLTAEGGDVNLKGVAVIMAEVGDIEDEVFRRRRANEERELQRRQNNNAQRKAGGAGRVGAAAARNDAVAVGSVITGRNKDARRRLDAQASSADPNTGAKDLNANMEAANKLKEQLKAKLAKKLDVTSDKDAAISPANALVEDNASAGKRKREEGDDEVEEDEDGFEDDIQENQEEDEDAKAEEIVHVMLATGAVEVEMAQSALKSRVKDRMQAQLDKHRDAVEDNVRLWEAGWKDRYYSDKCKLEDIAAGGGRERIKRAYVEGLCWVMNYYYKGVTDWTWYYPFHYSPFASDLLDCDSFDIKFSESEPFHPIEQLMAVLPPASAHALPEPCRRLMTEPESPIIDFYPNEILTDPNGKPMPWLWVVLLPFIDEKRLLLNMRSLYDQFSEEEKHRNSFGPSFVFVHSSHPLYKKLGSVLDGASETKELWVPATEAGGWSGTLAVPPAGAPCIPVGEDLEAPPKPPDVLHSIQNNQTACSVYIPPPRLPHVCRFLPGTVPMPNTLLPQDVVPRRPPRLNRGGLSIADFGKTKATGPGGFLMQQHQQQQQQQQQQQRYPQQYQQQPPQWGQPGAWAGQQQGQYFPPMQHQMLGQYPGYNMGWNQWQQQSQPMKAPTGARGWGSLEPTPKRQNVAGYGAVPLPPPPPPAPPGAYGFYPTAPGAYGAPPPPAAALPSAPAPTLESLRAKLLETLKHKKVKQSGNSNGQSGQSQGFAFSHPSQSSGR